MRPSARVLDLYAVPPETVPLAGGQGYSVLAGDLVLSPGRDEDLARWLNVILAPLSGELDNEQPRSLRLSMPIPTRDGRWTVDSWAATRYEPDTSVCTDLDVLLATAHLLHARLAERIDTEPDGIRRREDRWRAAELVAFGERRPAGIPAPIEPLVARILSELHATHLGPDQLVHGDLAGNVLLDASGIPFVIDFAPYWRPALWADAVCTLDTVIGFGADPAVMERWASGPERQAMLRAALFRLLSDLEPRVSAYETCLAAGPLRPRSGSQHRVSR